MIIFCLVSERNAAKAQRERNRPEGDAFFSAGGLWRGELLFTPRFPLVQKKKKKKKKLEIYKKCNDTSSSAAAYNIHPRPWKGVKEGYEEN